MRKCGTAAVKALAPEKYKDFMHTVLLVLVFTPLSFRCYFLLDFNSILDYIYGIIISSRNIKICLIPYLLPVLHYWWLKLDVITFGG